MTLGVQIKTGLYLVEPFTGDGSTVNFPLKRAPGNVGALDIVVAGVPQTTSYSVNGTTLTFSAAPANGAAIWVRHLGEQIQIGQPSANTVGADQMANGRLAPSYARLTHRVAAGTAGGTPTTGAWTPRVLNTIEQDDDSIITSLSSNQFTLQAGTYRINAIQSFYQVNAAGCRVYNVTDAAEALLGMYTYAGSASVSNVKNHVMGEFTIAAAKTFELQYHCASAGNLGNGLTIGTSDNLHAAIEIEKVK